MLSSCLNCCALLFALVAGAFNTDLDATVCPLENLLQPPPFGNYCAIGVDGCNKNCGVVYWLLEWLPFPVDYVLVLNSKEHVNEVSNIMGILAQCDIPFTAWSAKSSGSLINVNLPQCSHGGSILIFSFQDMLKDYTSSEECYTWTVTKSHALTQLSTLCSTLFWVERATESQLENFALNVSKISLSLTNTAYKNAAFNKVLRVGTVSEDSVANPFAKRVLTEDNVTKIEGITIEMLDYLTKKLKMQYELIEPPDGEYGAEVQPGVFSGLVGLLQRKEVDIVVADLTVSYSRSKVIQYASTPFHSEYIGIMFPKPEPKATLWSWTTPFSRAVWLSLLAATVAMSALLYLENIVGWRFGHSPTEKLGDCIFLAVRNMINQGVDFTPQTWCSAISLTFWYFTCLAVMASYSGDLVATLTTERLILPFDTFKELAALVAKGDYFVCTKRGISINDEFMKGNFPDYAAIGKQLKSNPSKYIQKTDADCIALMLKNEKIVFVQELHILQYLQQTFCANRTLIILSDVIYPTHFALAFQKGSPYESTFSIPMLQMAEAGLINNWKQKYMDAAGSCDTVDIDSRVSMAIKTLPLADMTGTFLMLCIGMCVSALVLAMERKSVRTFVKNQLGCVVSWYNGNNVTRLQN